MSDPTAENPEAFAQRKSDHLRISLLNEVQASGQSGLDEVELIHCSLPEINLSDVSIESSFLDQAIATPFYISGMTAGFTGADDLNSRFAELAASRGWIFGVGSQRRELNDDYLDASVSSLVSRFPKLKLVANLGLAQLIELHQSKKFSALFKILERSKASLVAIHLNPLQEAIQPEGTPHFRGGLAALSALTAESAFPVVVKETGSGMSASTLKQLSTIPLHAIDVSGKGGTHWGRIEGKRSPENSISETLGKTFQNWGVSTVHSVLAAVEMKQNLIRNTSEIWASGGVRSGLDAAKLLALGANRVGFAQPALIAATQGGDALNAWMNTMEHELKVALFCTGTATLSDFFTAHETDTL